MLSLKRKQGREGTCAAVSLGFVCSEFARCFVRKFDYAVAAQEAYVRILINAQQPWTLEGRPCHSPPDSEDAIESEEVAIDDQSTLFDSLHEDGPEQGWLEGGVSFAAVGHEVNKAAQAHCKPVPQEGEEGGGVLEWRGSGRR